MNNTQAFDIGVLIVDYLQSWEFLVLFFGVLTYKLARYGLAQIPDAVLKYLEWSARR